MCGELLLFSELYSWRIFLELSIKKFGVMKDLEIGFDYNFSENDSDLFRSEMLAQIYLSLKP
jgi:hypothetical protein